MFTIISTFCSKRLPDFYGNIFVEISTKKLLKSTVLLGCGETSLKKYLKQFEIRKTEVQEVRHKENLKYRQRLLSGKLKEHKKELSIKNAMTEMYFEQELTTTVIAKIYFKASLNFSFEPE